MTDFVCHQSSSGGKYKTETIPNLHNADSNTLQVPDVG
jgi:hypothetical protein